MIKPLLALPLAFFVVACAGHSPLREECLPLKNWTPEEQGQMAADLDLLPQDSPLGLAFLDYMRMRIETRACQSAE